MKSSYRRVIPVDESGAAILGPWRSAVAVTPDDEGELEGVQALWVGTGGTTLDVVMADGESVSFLNVPDGSLLPISIMAVLETTDSDDIVALLAPV